MRHHEIKTSVAAIVMAAGLVGGVFTQAELDNQKTLDKTLLDDSDEPNGDFVGDSKPTVWVGGYTEIFDLMDEIENRLDKTFPDVVIIPVLEESRLRYRMIHGIMDDYISDDEMLLNREYITWLANELRNDYAASCKLASGHCNDFMTFYEWLSFFEADFNRAWAYNAGNGFVPDSAFGYTMGEDKI